MIGRMIKARGRGALSALVGFLVFGTCAIPAFGPVGQALARGPQPGPQQGFNPGRHSGGAAPGRNPGGPAPGVVKSLPPGHGSIKFKGDRYYYHGGHYYRPHERGYVVVPPPRRMVVPRLPLGYATLMIAGITYFTYLGVYYQRVPAGYMIVAPPAGAAPPPPAVVQAYASVTVIASALNMRQGPGANYPVIYVAPLGETLNVLATAPGWLYVQAPGGQLGWVDQRFTSPLAPGASG